MLPDEDPTSDLLGGGTLSVKPGATLVDGYDFFDGDDADPDDSSYSDPGDPISQAVGTPGFMSNHVVGECVQHLAEGATTEPEEFDRYYFPPQEIPNYDGPAPLLIDVLTGLTPEEMAQEQEDKHTAFKADWCRSHGVRYVVLSDSEDMFLSPEQLRAKILAAIEPATAPAASTQTAATPASGLDRAIVARGKAPAKAKAKPGRRKAGVQRPRG